MPAPLHSHARSLDRGMSEDVRALSTRVIDPRAASKGFVVVALLAMPLLWWMAESLWVHADHETDATRALRDFADRDDANVVDPAPSSPRPLAILLVDGLRVDEAERSPALRAFRAGALHGTVRYPRPTLSTGAYHALVTGTPNRLSGVFTNRYHLTSGGGVARVDSLADRVRAVAGRERYVAEDLDWLLQLLTPRAEARELFTGQAFDAAARDAFAAFARDASPGLLVAHMLAVDESAHETGVDSALHAAALGRADALVAALHAAVDAQPALVALVIADHGHLDVGGHGGDEPEVVRAPFAIRGAQIADRDGDTLELAPECVAALLAGATGSATPRSSTCLGEQPTPGGLQRVAFAEDAARRQRGLHEARTLGLLGLGMLLTLMGLGATKRSFSGLDAGSVVAPLVWLAGTVVLHLAVLGRPLTLSAIHLVNPHVVAVGVCGAVSGALGMALGAWLAIARAGAGADPRLALRRAAGGLVWASIAAFGLAWARIGGAYSPWPVTAFAAYAPVFLAAAGVGALLAAAATLLGTMAKREVSYYERPTVGGSAPPGPGDMT
ncbi:MAG: alkaline phosphatase family protein [Sandaracinaceae bacterium]|nr:alkaline phosphatase family protein [Sandaracinaceae bacterium]